jgi:hypothetical protein
MRRNGPSQGRRGDGRQFAVFDRQGDLARETARLAAVDVDGGKARRFEQPGDLGRCEWTFRSYLPFGRLFSQISLG